MKKSDVKDTIECRKQIIKYIEYLENGNERMPEDFMMHIAKEIFSKASLIALKTVLERIADKLSQDVDNKFKTMEEADIAFNQARDKAIKHCMMLEIKHKHFKKNSIDRESVFANLRFNEK